MLILAIVAYAVCYTLDLAYELLKLVIYTIANFIWIVILMVQVCIVTIFIIFLRIAIAILDVIFFCIDPAITLYKRILQVALRLFYQSGLYRLMFFKGYGRRHDRNKRK